MFFNVLPVRSIIVFIICVNSEDQCILRFIESLVSTGVEGELLVHYCSNACVFS